MGSTKCIASIGELSRKDNSLCFKNEKKHVYIPVENVKEIYCFNEVSINSKLLDFLAQKNIIVHFFNYYGSIINVGVRENSLASTFIFLQKKKHKYILFG